MAKHAEFSRDAVNNALAAAKAHNKAVGLATVDADMNILHGGEFVVNAECISVTVQNHQVCLNLPLGIGSICLPIPISIPDGTAAQACLDICTTWGFPTGVRVTVSALGHVIIEKSFGKC